MLILILNLASFAQVMNKADGEQKNWFETFSPTP